MFSSGTPRRTRSSAVRSLAHRTSSARARHRASHSSASGMSSTAVHTSGSSARRRQPSGRYRSSTAAMCGPSQVGRCTPLVTWVMGTDSTGPGNMSFHIDRATSPCR